MQTLMPFIVRLTQAAGWSLLHSLWQGALIWLLLVCIYRAFPLMNARLKYSCGVIGMLLLSLWIGNTAITQWEQLKVVTVHVVAGASAGPGYTVQVPAATSDTTIGNTGVQFASLMPWLMLCYLGGLLIMIARLGMGVVYLHRLRTRDNSLPPDNIQQLLQSLQLKAGILQTVAIRISTQVVVPLVIGVLRPMILLPVTTIEDFSPEELEAILLHELGHIRRADFIINILQCIVEALLFFNPFVWRISAAIRREREHCCDDIVVTHTLQPVTYARALASIATRQQQYTALTLAATGHQPLLFNRIKRIIEMKKHPIRYGQIIAACTLAILITVSIVWLSPSFAQERKKSKASEQREEEGRRNGVDSTSGVIIVNNGVSHAYKSLADMPARMREQLQRTLKEKDLELDRMQEALDKMEILNEDSLNAIISNATSKAINAAQLSSDIRRQVDSALQQVADIDWTAIQREVSAEMEKAETTMKDPSIKEELKRGMMLAQKETDRSVSDRQRNIESNRQRAEITRQSMVEARRDLQRAREEMRRAKEEMKRLRNEGRW